MSEIDVVNIDDVFGLPRCPTLLCYSKEMMIDSVWHSNMYCHFRKAKCIECKALFWIVFRDNKYSVVPRTSEVFEHRRNKR